MRYFVTGCAGFIGSTLTDRLLEDGHSVVGYDNFSTGLHPFLTQALRSPNFRLVEGDLLDSACLAAAMKDTDMVFHLAANADVRFGTLSPQKDLQQNTVATSNVLEAMRKLNISNIAFSSTGSVYGEPTMFPTPEDCPFPVQTSLYGASKVAAEALISAYHYGFGFRAFIFRFVSILGERYTHGHVLDFYRKLLVDPRNIQVLGNGKQRKSYLYVGDCIDGMLHAVEQSDESLAIINLGTNEHCAVDDSLAWICAELGMNPVRQYTGDERGWIGDSPFIFLDCSKLRSLGWQPQLTIREAVVRTLGFLRANAWVMEARPIERS
jgi:UDP-glucose 4-epimerase